MNCPECGSERIMGNRTPMNPEDLARNPWFCRDCRTYFGGDDA